MTTLRAALEDIADIGPFFAVSANPAEVVDDSWRPWADYYAGPGPIDDRIAQVASALGLADQPADRRIAASIAYQGLAARLVSPILGLASVHGLVAPWSPESLHWRRAVAGVLPMWESAERAAAPEPERLADQLARVLVEPHLEALARVTAAASGVSPRTLRGNAASALAAAGRLVASARPAAATRSHRLVSALLTSGPLAGTGTLGSNWAFRRRSCCLYYRVPGGGVCGDCVLNPR